MGDIKMSETPSTGLSGSIGDIITKLLGPIAEDYGQDLLAWKRKRKENADKILLNAGGKLGDKLNSPGRVPLKVFKTVINEGSYFDDAIAVEYFGGNYRVYFKTRLAFTIAVFNLLVQWDGLPVDADGFVPLSIAQFTL